jgi:hypothetical protein
MNWITRGRPKTDRIACPWLITKFIDHDATIVFVAPDQVLDVAAQLGGHSFDAPGATYTHRADHCTFEVLIDEYVLGDDPALALLAIIVHAADIEGELDSHPVGAGLLAIGVGGHPGAASTSRPTTTSWSSAAPSSMTRSTRGANVRWRATETGQ